MCFEITVLGSGKKKKNAGFYICTKMNSECGNDLSLRNCKVEEKKNMGDFFHKLGELKVFIQLTQMFRSHKKVDKLNDVNIKSYHMAKEKIVKGQRPTGKYHG